MTDAATAAAMPPAATRCDLEDERRAAENHAGSSKSWDGAYSEQGKATTPQLALVQESELELTLSLGCFGTAGKKAAKKEVSWSVDSRTSISSSSTESDVLNASGREWRQARGTPYHHKRRPGAGLDVVQAVDDGVGMQAPPPLLFHWLSLKMA